MLCALVLLPACSLVTNVPDLTSGAAVEADAGAVDVDAADAGRICPPHLFTYDPHGRVLTSVHVAGSFNGWPKTIAAGGWALTKTGATWAGSHELPSGTSLYKLVLNESEWITDPSNPNKVPDGFGGENSVLDVDCSEGG